MMKTRIERLQDNFTVIKNCETVQKPISQHFLAVLVQTFALAVLAVFTGIVNLIITHIVCMETAFYESGLKGLFGRR
jgi:ABC-type polysaccharide transport system permease subunit